MKRNLPNKSKTNVGMSLVELLAVIAVISILAGGGVYMIMDSLKSAREQKLVSDVATLNSALKSFVANGGSLDGATTGELVMERLKTRATTAQQDELVGVRAAFLDSRIMPVMQTSAEAATAQSRVLWDASKARFVVKNAGAAGFKGFVIDESKAAVVEAEKERETTIKYAKKGNDKWVWEYADQSTAGYVGPGNLAPGGSPGVPSGPYVPPSVLKLDPPVVSIPGGTFPIADFETLLVSLSNPNPPGVSELFYSVVPGVWERYFGPILIDPGTDLVTQSVTIHPDVWDDSDEEIDEYRTMPVQLEIDLDFSVGGYDFVSLGGALVPGTYPAPTLVQPGEVYLSNRAAIPDRFENSSVFEIVWTFDGSNPLVSPTALTGDPFSGGFPGQDVPMGIDDWGSGDTVTVRVAAKSLDNYIVSDSSIEEVRLTRDKLQLRPPLVTVDTYAGAFDLALDSTSGTTPMGARIYSVLDGDPGIAATGEPVSGALFTGGQVVPPDSGTLTARTYAPVAYMDWFLPSDAASATITVIGSNELYVGGEFSAGGSMRNIARLSPTGSLDSGFNPGAGASAGSVVGAISGQGAAGVLAGGNFDTMNGIPRMGIARLRFDGSVDATFNANLQ